MQPYVSQFVFVRINGGESEQAPISVVKCLFVYLYALELRAPVLTPAISLFVQQNVSV